MSSASDVHQAKMQCTFSNWYPHFRKYTMKSEVSSTCECCSSAYLPCLSVNKHAVWLILPAWWQWIELPESFVAYLTSEVRGYISIVICDGTYSNSHSTGRFGASPKFPQVIRGPFRLYNVMPCHMCCAFLLVRRDRSQRGKITSLDSRTYHRRSHDSWKGNILSATYPVTCVLLFLGFRCFWILVFYHGCSHPAIGYVSCYLSFELHFISPGVPRWLCIRQT